MVEVVTQTDTDPPAQRQATFVAPRVVVCRKALPAAHAAAALPLALPGPQLAPTPIHPRTSHGYESHHALQECRQRKADEQPHHGAAGEVPPRTVIWEAYDCNLCCNQGRPRAMKGHAYQGRQRQVWCRWWGGATANSTGQVGFGWVCLHRVCLPQVVYAVSSAVAHHPPLQP